ncbi:MAG: DnaA regulatory inactivator Hda [Hydrogenovibrio sp.]
MNRASENAVFVQLPLKIGLRDEASFDTFVTEDEATVLALSRFQQSLASRNRHEAFYLRGESGVGKTHLLQAACRFVTEQQRTSVYVPLNDERLSLIPDVLNGLETMPLVCLDDVDAIVGEAAWEKALAKLLMRSKELGHQVVLSGQEPMGDWRLVTRVLTQALMGVLPISIQPLHNPQDLVIALQRHSAKLGFKLPLAVGNYLVRQYSTDLQELLSVLKILEQATFVEKRRLTLPFVKQTLSRANPA